MFECDRCGKCFASKQSLERHKTTKTTCYTITTDVDYNSENELEEFVCSGCKRNFTTKGSLTRHNKKPPTTCLMFGKINNMANEFVDLKNTINQRKLGNTIINQNQINNQMVHFVKPGNENIEHITKEKILEIMKGETFQDVCRDFMKLMYFSKEVPENSGWCIIYPKNENAALVLNHDTKTFERKNIFEIIDNKFTNMMDKLSPLVNEIYNDPELRDKLSTNQKRNIYQFYNHFGMTNISQDSPMVYKAIHSMAYDIKQVPMDSWKEQGLDAKHLSIKF